METSASIASRRSPWNKSKLVRQNVSSQPQRHMDNQSSSRVCLQLSERYRQLILFNLAIDSKLRGSALFALRVRDICHGRQVASGAIVVLRKTRKLVAFETTDAAQATVAARIEKANLRSDRLICRTSLH